MSSSSMALQRRQEPTSKTRSLEFFLASIKDPHNPRHCAVCLDGAFRECTDVKKWPDRKLKNRPNSAPKHNGELWNPIVKFLFVRRTNKQMKRLLISLSECTCRMDQEGGDVQGYHQNKPNRPSLVRLTNDHYEHDESPERRMFAQPWHQFLSNVFHSLNVPLQQDGPTSAAVGRSTSWPHSSTDLIPYGADTLVESMLQWYRFIPDTIIFNLMASIIELCRELVIPSVVKYKFTKVVVDSTKQELDRIMSDHGSINNDPSTEIVGYPGSFSQLMDPRPVSFDPEYRSDRRTGVPPLLVWRMHSADAILYFMTCIIIVFHDDYKAALFQDCEIKALQLCSLVIYILYSQVADEKICPPSNDQIEGIVQTAQELYRFFHIQRRFQLDIPVHPLIKERDDARCRSNMLRTSSVGMEPLSMLIFFRIDMRCSAMGCTNSLQTAGKGFQRCGSCEIVGYCGRDCQKKAWKDDIHPHKPLCPIIKNMVEKAGGYETFLACTRRRTEGAANAMEAVKSNWEKAKFDAGDLKLFTDWGDVVYLLRGLPLLSQRQLSPGFSDYENILNFLCTADGAPKPVHFSR